VAQTRRAATTGEGLFRVPAGVDRTRVYGVAERNLKLMREALGVQLSARDGDVRMHGEGAAVAAAGRVLNTLAVAAREDRSVTRQQLLDLIAGEMHSRSGEEDFDEPSGPRRTWDGRLDVYAHGRQIKPKTPNQDRYLEAIRDHDLVFALGPAGTGKTYLAVAAAVHMLKTGLVTKVILVRPAVEAGEKLGFLPGDFQAKLNPYLRPLFDALHDMMDFPTIRRFMENDVVEVIPLAYMRGRTLNKAVIILDEAQNATRGQMKMFLTRLGHGSKMIVTGDPSQTDLPDTGQGTMQSGLVDAATRLSKTEGVGFVGFERGDVVRHPLVQRVIDAYEDDGTADGR
jgi:phosphate starvation-inducible protein PhoH and related proteins